MKEIIIVGAGWAGLSAAISLGEAGYQPTILEAADLPGGRARNLPNHPERDNGQHLLVGAYRDTLQILERLDIQRREVFHETAIHLLLRPTPRTTPIRIKGGHLPGQFHLLQALISARGLDWTTKIVLLGARRLLRTPILIDTNVHEWLLTMGQTPRAIECLWGPLCLAAINLTPEMASARIFQRTLQETFASPSTSSFLIPKLPLGKLLPTPALQRLERMGAKIRLGSRVTALSVVDNHVSGVRLRNGEQIAGRNVILAVAHQSAAQLLGKLPETRNLASNLLKLGQAPIVTAYIQYDEKACLDPPMQTLLDGTRPWLFDRRIANEPGLIAAVLSGPGETTSLERHELTRQIISDIHRHFPHWGKPRNVRVIREKAATFLATPDNETLRPSCRTEVDGLWLAGDYCATGLPATLEGAVRSGIECSTKIIRGVG